MLLKTVTAFTPAHNLALALATLSYANASVLPLNAAIALGILFLAPKSCVPGSVSRVSRFDIPGVFVFVFGLLHGFGFASALTSAAYRAPICR